VENTAEVTRAALVRVPGDALIAELTLPTPGGGPIDGCEVVDEATASALLKDASRFSVRIWSTEFTDPALVGTLRRG
jgi:hypothetical protein